MTDTFNRKIEYLRLSVTDLCNYRCIYCMGEKGIEKKSHGDILSIEELTEIAEAASLSGISKIRLTGGEPLVRKGIITLCRNISEIKSVKNLGMTTNGSLLKDFAHPLKENGVDSVNISLDTLDPERFKRITRCGSLDDVIQGIKAAIDEGFENIKINCVLMNDTKENDIRDFLNFSDEYDLPLRFIELMPIGEVNNMKDNRYISSKYVKDIILKEGYTEDHTEKIAKIYKSQNKRGSIGLISPISGMYCERCDRIRVTCDGKLKPCLHSKDEINLKGLHGEDLLNAIKEGIMMKPKKHNLISENSYSLRKMYEIGG